MADVAKSLKEEKIQNLRLRLPLLVSRKTLLREVLEKMREKKRGCVVVTDNKKIVGIFTERDAMTKVAEKGTSLETTIEQLMTPNPRVLRMEDTVAEAIRVMNEGKYRHIPLVNEAGEAQGVLGVRDIIRYLAEHFPYEVYNLPPDPHQVIRAPEGA
jgi:CBS domain-containing protein